MEPKNLNLEKIIWQELIKGERARDQRSFFRKIHDDVAHNIKVLFERFSPIN